MKYFDLHCDSLTKCFNSHDSLISNANHISLEKAKCLDGWSQFFAVFIPDTFSVGYARTYFSECASSLKEQLGENPCRAYLTVENCGFIENADGVELLIKSGAAAASLTWNGDNRLACGSETKNDLGLSENGRATVKRLQKENIIVDVSHASEKTFWDIARISDKPIIASHSNCWEVRRSKRNLTDEQVACIIESDGLIGINFCQSFLPLDRPLFEGIYENVIHIAEMGGENNIALGGDFDGCFMPPCIDGIDKIPELYSFLRYKGIKREQADKIFFGNAQKFVNKYLQKP